MATKKKKKKKERNHMEFVKQLSAENTACKCYKMGWSDQLFMYSYDPMM